MSSPRSNRRQKSRHISAAAGAAAAAALVSLGLAPAANAELSWSWLFGDTSAAGADAVPNAAAATGTVDDPVVNPYLPPNGYTNLFGAFEQQGAANHALDVQMAAGNLAQAEQFSVSVDNFQTFGAHGLSNLIYSLIPTSFYHQVDPLIDGGAGAETFLVPDSSLGYLATGLDYWVFNPTGLGWVLEGLGAFLAGAPAP